MPRALAFLALAAATAALVFAPPPEPLADDTARTAVCEVVSTDDSGLARHGLIEFGTQRLRVRFPDGTVRDAANELRAQLELDKRFAPGDSALVVVPRADDGESMLVARDHWRLGWGAALFALFAASLVAFGGWTGAKALFSFVFGCLAVWKLLIPLARAGRAVSAVVFLVVAALTVLIMYLVAGWTRKALAAAAGALAGVAASLAFGAAFTRLMHVTGATMPYAQQLLYSGHSALDLRDLFLGAIVLASSGAVMDLAMDIASAVDEVSRRNPALGFGELLLSGFRVGRAVTGTMTTTLLFAYSGGFLSLLMVFAAEGTSPLDFLNSTLVSAELVKTLVGSFGLVLVAPFTAFAAAFVYSRRAHLV